MIPVGAPFLDDRVRGPAVEALGHPEALGAAGVAPEVTREVSKLLAALEGERSPAERLADPDPMWLPDLHLPFAAGRVEVALPDKPRRSKQHYRPMDAGRGCSGAQPKGDER
ncbi:MAG: hypothetical protein ABMA64_01025 [Myxococcota bacterium]